MQLDEHLEPRPPLPAEATQLELLHAQMASLQARVRKMEEEAAAPSASGIFSLKENSVLSTAAEDASAKEGDLLEEADVSSVFNMYGWCLDTAFGDVQEWGGVNLLSASGKILLLAALAFIQLTFAFGVYDVSMLFKLRDDTNAFKPFVDNSLFYADAATDGRVPIINIYCSAFSLLLLSLLVRQETQGTILSMCPLEPILLPPPPAQRYKPTAPLTAAGMAAAVAFILELDELLYEQIVPLQSRAAYEERQSNSPRASSPIASRRGRTLEPSRRGRTLVGFYSNAVLALDFAIGLCCYLASAGDGGKESRLVPGLYPSSALLLAACEMHVNYGPRREVRALWADEFRASLSLCSAALAGRVGLLRVLLYGMAVLGFACAAALLQSWGEQSLGGGLVEFVPAIGQCVDQAFDPSSADPNAPLCGALSPSCGAELYPRGNASSYADFEVACKDLHNSEPFYSRLQNFIAASRTRALWADELRVPSPLCGEGGGGPPL
ncbi:hypothetical protein EMIHUDRAFT_107699 [Emiliania huxleyi CCMP1516]|uniref:Uncharacterized protein n=2 Tax=Emiliania huxleyi TaxID=2903 RepID=A0A0D3HZW2_EMIH1|nr:hypothetical protein EMIHUDRAFT_107699 [Emiliania huxleyi CCMP1516]EOD04547.1 hypothetical protein EMIHUDRAFT_107699 [Emiliania huxleyi CCMP1516]|eukprot:XP_005756976.1 hypothetical protein EMIHUDRAFT_107699 [Emiliania huxleyi CCMP1516]